MPRILIIEDDQDLQNVYVTILTKENFEVEVASNGAEGLEKARATEPDLILLDLLMPTMDGMEFLKQYDAKGEHPNVKVIVFSNLSIPSKINEAVELGASNFKTKAMSSPREMVQLIRDTLKSASP